MRSNLSLIVVGLTMALAAPSRAEDGSGKALAAYTAKPEHVAALMGAVRPYYTVIPSCTPGTAKRVALQIVQPVTVDEQGQIVGGVWIEHVKVDGCNTSGLFNVLTIIKAGANPIVGGLLPGDTHASFLLQRDALPTARSLALTKLQQGCTDAHAVDTAFQDFGPVVSRDVAPGRDARSWSEQWTFTGCGQQVAVRVRFIPDKTGTSFDVSL